MVGDVHPLEGCGLLFKEALINANRAQRLDRAWQNSKARADLTQLRRLLKHCGRAARLTKRSGQRHSTDTTTNNNDPHSTLSQPSVTPVRRACEEDSGAHLGPQMDTAVSKTRTGMTGG